LAVRLAKNGDIGGLTLDPFDLGFLGTSAMT